MEGINLKSLGMKMTWHKTNLKTLHEQTQCLVMIAWFDTIIGIMLCLYHFENGEVKMVKSR